MTTNDENKLIEQLLDQMDDRDPEELVGIIRTLSNVDPESEITVVNDESDETVTVPARTVLRAASSELLSRAMAIIVLTEDERVDEMLTSAPTDMLRLAVSALKGFIVDGDHSGIDGATDEQMKTRTILAEAELQRRDATAQRMNA